MAKDMTRGRFAPSPTGELHVGNLRTAMAAWQWAKSIDGDFIVRMEDLDRVTSSREHEAQQLRDLAAIGLTWSLPVVRQSQRFELYHAAIAELTAAGRTYRCWCSRREIAEAASAPHGDVAAGYPGTCRSLSAHEIAERERSGQPAALRLRGDGVEREFDDGILGVVRGRTDDIVLRRRDGVPAYHVAVVVDDADQGVTHVLRGADLAEATLSQLRLQEVLGLPTPTYAHIPLAVNANRDRLAKRDGAITLRQMMELGVDAASVRDRLLESLGMGESRGMGGSLETGDGEFALGRIPRDPWVVT